MLADAAAKEIGRDLKALGGASFKVTTVKRTTVNISVSGVSAEWIWECTDEGVRMRPQAAQLLRDVEAIWNAYRLQRMNGDLPVYSYDGTICYDYKIRKPELQNA